MNDVAVHNLCLDDQPAWLLAAVDQLMPPVRARVQESRRWFSRWRDPYAERILKQHQKRQPDSGKALPKWIGLRARCLDEVCAEQLSLCDHDAVIEIGSGLSTRYQRLAESKQNWFSLDSPLVYRCWALFFAETRQHRYIPAHEPCRHWMSYLRRYCSAPLIIMENYGRPANAIRSRLWRESFCQYFPNGRWVDESVADIGLLPVDAKRSSRGKTIVLATGHPAGTTG